MGLDEAYLPTNWHLDPSRRLATIDMGLFCRGELGPHLAQYGLGTGMLILDLGIKAKFLGLGILWPWP